MCYGLSKLPLSKSSYTPTSAENLGVSGRVRRCLFWIQHNALNVCTKGPLPPLCWLIRANHFSSLFTAVVGVRSLLLQSHVTTTSVYERNTFRLALHGSEMCEGSGVFLEDIIDRATWLSEPLMLMFWFLLCIDPERLELEFLPTEQCLHSFWLRLWLNMNIHCSVTEHVAHNEGRVWSVKV